MRGEVQSSGQVVDNGNRAEEEKVTRSLGAALAGVGLFGLVLAMPFAGIWPAEPWDAAAFTLLSLGIPLAGLVATLAFVARELPKPWGLSARATRSAWQSVLAVVVSLVLFVGGWILFLRPFQH